MKNLKKILFLILVGSIFMITTNCSDFDDQFEKIGIPQTIKKEDDLYDLLVKVTTPGNNPFEEIVCLDFIYVFKIFIYDSNQNIIGEKLLTGDLMFSDFLENLPDNQTISISYPIETTLANGDTFSVNNNAELKLALDSCSREDIIAYCNDLFGGSPKCVWKSIYGENTENKFAGGVFDIDDNGNLKLSYDQQVLNGTWVFLFVNDKLHLNISIEGTTPLAQYWSIDREINLEGDKIRILKLPKNILLKIYCEETATYTIGSTGTGGGTVFYDKGFYSKGWRYIEAAPVDCSPAEWGCFGTAIVNTDKTEVGDGILNTILNVNYHDSLDNFYTNPIVCNALNNGTVAAKTAIIFENNTKKDWFLPSKKELNLIHQNLKLANLGNFGNTFYWSSSQIDNNTTFAKNFVTGIDIAINKAPNQTNIRTRAIRYF